MKRFKLKNALLGLAIVAAVFQLGCSNNIVKLQQSANSGNAQAQYELGFKYEAGIDVPKDIGTARYLYGLSADQGNELAKNSLSRLGVDVPKPQSYQSLPHDDSASQFNNVVVATDNPTNDQIETQPLDSSPLKKSSKSVNKKKQTEANALDSALDVDFANAEINNGFIRWSSVWYYDRYVPNSAQLIDGGIKDGAYIARGNFSFIRGRASHSIPFIAAFTNLSGGYVLANLCYNDNTSGMTDCINPTADEIGKVQSRQSLGRFLGIIALMHGASNSYDDSEDDYDPNCNTGYVNLLCGLPRWLR